MLIQFYYLFYFKTWRWNISTCISPQFYIPEPNCWPWEPHAYRGRRRISDQSPSSRCRKNEEPPNQATWTTRSTCHEDQANQSFVWHAPQNSPNINILSAAPRYLFNISLIIIFVGCSNDLTRSSEFLNELDYSFSSIDWKGITYLELHHEKFLEEREKVANKAWELLTGSFEIGDQSQLGLSLQVQVASCLNNFDLGPW